MSSSSLDIQLDLLESQLGELSASLVEGNAPGLQDASMRLQPLVVELVRLADAVGRQALGQQGRLIRLRKLSAALGMVRENLARQAAYVDQALALVVPGAQPKSTYAGSNRGYGSPVRQSGAFSVLSA
jgi:hypothetical protein